MFLLYCTVTSYFSSKNNQFVVLRIYIFVFVRLLHKDSVKAYGGLQGPVSLFDKFFKFLIDEQKASEVVNNW